MTLYGTIVAVTFIIGCVVLAWKFLDGIFK